jgi:hypothetical protein
MSIETIAPSTAKTVMNEKFLRIAYDEKSGILFVKWIGFLRLDDVTKGGNFLLDFVKKNKIIKNFNDQTDLKVLSADVQRYLTTQLFPEIEKAGLSKIGVLVSEDVFAQATVNNVNAKVTMGGLTMQTFVSPKLCLEWLTSSSN